MLSTELFMQSITRYKNKTNRPIWDKIHLDFPLFLGILILIILGFFVLYSASNQQMSIVIQEIIHIGLATCLMIFLAQLPPSFYERIAPWLFFIGFLLLVAVLFVGHIEKGGRRWLSLGLFRFQPSEIMKLAVPLMLSWFFAHRQLPPKAKDLLISSFIIFIPFALVAKQPDLGTAITLAVGGGCVLVFAGMRWKIIAILAILAALSVPFLWHFMHSYQQQRVLIFLNPELDPLGAGYHIIQSKIAIGSGGFLGKGWLQGTQAHLAFLPLHATDFIFAVIGEEFGLFGGIVLLAVCLFITGRCLYIAFQAQDTFERLLAGSLSLMFFLSVFINIGMVSGLLPVVGVPLPLISYGGTSMITTMAGFGILMSIKTHKKLIPK